MQTREDWLANALAEARPVVEALTGAALAERIRVGVGFPSTFTRSGTVSQFWNDTASADSHAEIIISPTLADPGEVFGHLLSQVLHSLPGATSRGSASYVNACAAVQLGSGDGFKTLQYGPDYFAQWGAIIESLGPYPHGELGVAEKKTQSTRMLKLVCPTCGYIIRTTGKWVATGLPVCHDGDTFTIESGE